MPDHATTEDKLTAAVHAARAAGILLKQGLDQPHTVRTKSTDTDLLTEIDLRSESAVLEALRDRFPDDAFLAEESGGTVEDSGTWIIDPLDGTTNFAHGIPFFSVAIAYVDASGIRLGVVFDPVRDELFQAVQGQGAFLNGKSIQVSETTNLNQSLLTTGFPYAIRTAKDNNLDHYAELALRTQGVRRLGSAALDLAYVAVGRFDGYWELLSYPWDVAAGMLLVAEAGGTVSQTTGDEPPRFTGPTGISVLATNGRIHAAMLAVLAQDGGDPS